VEQARKARVAKIQQEEKAQRRRTRQQEEERARFHEAEEKESIAKSVAKASIDKVAREKENGRRVKMDRERKNEEAIETKRDNDAAKKEAARMTVDAAKVRATLAAKKKSETERAVESVRLLRLARNRAKVLKLQSSEKIQRPAGIRMESQPKPEKSSKALYTTAAREYCEKGNNECDTSVDDNASDGAESGASDANKLIITATRTRISPRDLYAPDQGRDYQKERETSTLAAAIAFRKLREIDAQRNADSKRRRKEAGERVAKKKEARELIKSIKTAANTPHFLGSDINGPATDPTIDGRSSKDPANLADKSREIKSPSTQNLSPSIFGLRVGGIATVKNQRRMGDERGTTIRAKSSSPNVPPINFVSAKLTKAVDGQELLHEPPAREESEDWIPTEDHFAALPPCAVHTDCGASGFCTLKWHCVARQMCTPSPGFPDLHPVDGLCPGLGGHSARIIAIATMAEVATADTVLGLKGSAVQSVTVIHEANRVARISFGYIDGSEATWKDRIGSAESSTAQKSKSSKVTDQLKFKIPAGDRLIRVNARVDGGIVRGMQMSTDRGVASEWVGGFEGKHVSFTADLIKDEIWAIHASEDKGILAGVFTRRILT
jgi:hypothetical protein